MTPSANQRGAPGEEYETDPEKVLATKNDLTIAAVIRGIADPERARSYAVAEAAREPPRQWVVALANQRLRELEVGDGD